MKKTLLVAALVLTACAATVAPHSPQADGCRTFKYSPSFTRDEASALVRAAQRWNVVAAEPFCVEPATSDAPSERQIFKIRYRGEIWQTISDTFDGADVYGVHYSVVDRIGIIDVLSTELFELVALHEFGHAHGLDHTEGPSVMHANIMDVRDFTSIDIAECRRVGACLGD